MVEPLPSKSTTRQVVEKVAEATFNAVPVIGGPLAVVFATAVGWSLSKRTDQWLTDPAEHVQRLEQSLNELVEQPAFVDAVVAATRAAQATHQAEKLRALRNGVLHSVGPDAPAEDEQARFFRLIEQFSPAHLRLLALLADPVGFYERNGLPVTRGGFSSSRTQLIDGALPELRDQPDWTRLLFSDLVGAMLINGTLGGMMSADGMWQPIVTPLGGHFLAFITD